MQSITTTKFHNVFGKEPVTKQRNKYLQTHEFPSNISNQRYYMKP